ncbi:thioredoxin family protein [Mesonia mobilis]|uniref:thioredoxin family protein n=2 Tax=Mesonia mobilis TaxID=369791 RepID=UPI0026F254AE|nr:thioredoxin fold domain-containing protein [Mesonia mobilis]
MMKLLLYIFLLISYGNAFAQTEIDWLNFEQLEVKLKEEPKPILIYFYADWCAYCKKMDRHAFKDQKVIELLAKDFYAVKMNAETKDTLVFDGARFINDEVETHRSPTHQLAKLLASRNDQAFSLPALILLNKDFKVIDRKFSYLTSDRMLELLKYSR